MDRNNNRLNFVSSEIIYSDGGFLAADDRIIALLKEKALEAPRLRCRLCFHESADAAQQEMLIVMNRASYVRPHRHLGKVETLTVVEGTCDALLFDDAGNVTETIAMSPAGTRGCFFYRMPSGIFHTLIFRSEWLVFLETTIGPFDRAMTEVADWAPPETDPTEGHAYLSGLTPPS
ncbi:WbuC family cupin fold metalloprotein [Bradyrhizobium sp.]|uniref:WbuC family cupin fold metalloprotein n=1 Tax=Bradyrhizobium sp. TaxID=376 RepID=UPI004038227A